MPGSRIWARLLGVEKTVVESVGYEEGTEELVARVRPKAGQRRRCGICQRRSPWYDSSAKRRRWRGLDLGSTVVYLEAGAARVRCRNHGVVVAHVPWGRHGAGHTYHFDDQVAWLATQSS